ncbi:UDP-N-acetylglucosamine 1-carboxyvinyltransferase [Paraclostridium bifermentans]|uniref:UDP-N-acetylglucosamine 1-carboxyvinyltransferase n=1 Tax=Paraclostridium bifermentans TaxID=1490 RepID=A0A5P3XHZ6_PARBF|nr:UDP-N-acetylglucosamine 1-carboxyvinyltransferase [Paraclostridium bifermentans]QEZ69905.1 UDP-N-acetylglucosamine 1-carboxyvinyltransferase [Paraclostridium bifermentans]
MSKYIISGGNKVEGRLDIRGAKNSVLPIMAASILNESENIIKNIPDISDVHVMIDILKSVGCKVEYNEYTLYIDSKNVNVNSVKEEYMKKLRSSIIVMGAMIGRFNNISISYPGGCSIGSRPIDLHLYALDKLGVKITEDRGYIYCNREYLVGNTINLTFPSVGATENAMLAAVKAKGITIINNAAREPEIEDLQDFLNLMGAKVSGAGTSCIQIEGVDKLHSVEHTIIPDRIAIGTYMIASAITGGYLQVDRVIKSHMDPIVSRLEELGCNIEYKGAGLELKAPSKIAPIDIIKTSPHPGFPTDMQSQLMTLLCLSEGTSIFHESIFENRFMHCGELSKMGANIIKITENICMVKGVNKLVGAKVEASDLRGGAALILAGLAAEGITEVTNISHVERGYEHIEKTLKSLGADIKKI